MWHGSFYSPVQDKLHPHVISCRGFSKNLATQSWRVGYIVSHPDTVSAVLAQHDPMYISVPILQHAVGQYLAHHIDEFKAHVAKLRDMMRANVAAFGEALPRVLGWEMLPPDGSMYVMFRHSEGAAVLFIGGGRARSCFPSLPFCQRPTLRPYSRASSAASRLQRDPCSSTVAQRYVLHLCFRCSLTARASTLASFASTSD